MSNANGREWTRSRSIAPGIPGPAGRGRPGLRRLKRRTPSGNDGHPIVIVEMTPSRALLCGMISGIARESQKIGRLSVTGESAEPRKATRAGVFAVPKRDQVCFPGRRSIEIRQAILTRETGTRCSLRLPIRSGPMSARDVVEPDPGTAPRPSRHQRGELRQQLGIEAAVASCNRERLLRRIPLAYTERRLVAEQTLIAQDRLTG